MKAIIILLLFCTVSFAQQKKDTLINYYDGRHKLIDFDKLGPKDEIILPIYRSKYFYDEKSKKWIEIRCRLKRKEKLTKSILV